MNIPYLYDITMIMCCEMLYVAPFGRDILLYVCELLCICMYVCLLKLYKEKLTKKDTLIKCYINWPRCLVKFTENFIIMIIITNSDVFVLYYGVVAKSFGGDVSRRYCVHI